MGREGLGQGYGGKSDRLLSNVLSGNSIPPAYIVQGGIDHEAHLSARDVPPLRAGIHTEYAGCQSSSFRPVQEFPQSVLESWSGVGGLALRIQPKLLPN